MKTLVTQYDLRSPTPIIWIGRGYSHILILVRNHRHVVDILRIPLQHNQTGLSYEDVEMEIEWRLDLNPVIRMGARHMESGINEEPRISVVVCTRERPNSLRRCLRALSQLDYGHYEVVVVDNASQNKETADVVAATPFRYVREDRPGLDWARNRGWLEATHNIIAYVDDDVVVDRYWLRGIAQAFADPEVSAVTGLVLPSELETPAQGWFETYGNGMSKGMVMKRFCGNRMSAFDLIAVQEVGVGGNMAIRRNVLEELGGFDTALDVGTPSGGAGDLDMFHRVLVAGGILHYEPNALVWHQHRRDMGSLQKLLYHNGRSYGIYLIKRWKEGRVSRAKMATFVLRRWIPWLIGRILLKTLLRHRLPFLLLWAEFWGALQAPWGFISTYRHDQKLREKT